MSKRLSSFLARRAHRLRRDRAGFNQKFPVPALYGWLQLDRRGQWRLRGERISHPRIIEFINRNYTADEHGCWYFQNGPQRGYVALAYTPLVLRVEGQNLVTHTGAPIDDAEAAYLDEEGSLVLDTPLGAGLIADNDLGWVLDRLRAGDAEADEAQLAAALAQPAGASTPLRLILNTTPLPVIREDATVLPQCLGFVREPQPPTGTS